jgi:hypothetical protein
LIDDEIAFQSLKPKPLRNRNSITSGADFVEPASGVEAQKQCEKRDRELFSFLNLINHETGEVKRDKTRFPLREVLAAEASSEEEEELAQLSSASCVPR